MKIQCPFCLHKFDNSKAQLLCGNRTQKCRLESTKNFTEFWRIDADDPSAQRPHIYNGKHGLFGGPVKLSPCPVCGDDKPDYVCPHCHNALPYDLVQNGSDIIPIIGGPAVGKSCFMIALLHELNLYGYRLNISSSLQSMYGGSLSENPAQLYSKMHKTLFKDHQVLEKTPVKSKVSIPWFIKIDILNSKKKIKPTYLVFYDIAGERFLDAETMKLQAQPLGAASGIIVLLDTSHIPVVHKALVEDEKVPDTSTPEVMKIIDDLQQYLEHETGITKGEKKSFFQDIPIALAFSKGDLISQYRDSLPEFGDVSDLKKDSNFKDSAFRLPESYKKKDFNKFLMDCHQTTKVYLDVLTQNELHSSIYKYKLDQKESENEYKYLDIVGVSALGQAPEQDASIDTEKIDPYRVLDPLIWILHKLHKLDISE